jgi:hypothetical protein
MALPPYITLVEYATSTQIYTDIRTLLPRLPEMNKTEIIIDEGIYCVETT